MHDIFKKSLAAFIVALLLTGSAANAQVFSVNFMDAKSADYVQLETEIWKPIHEQRAAAGELLSWTLYSVPSGFDDKYSHVTVEVYADLDALSAGYANINDHAAAAHPDLNWDEASERTGAARDVVDSEIWGGVEFIGDFHESPVLTIARMKVKQGGGGAYVGMESNIFKPLQQARIDAGDMGAWGIYALRFPGGAAYPYNFAAVNWYSSLGHIDSGSLSFADLVAQVHPNLSTDQINHMVNNTRKLTELEIWYTIEHVHNDEFAAGAGGASSGD